MTSRVLVVFVDAFGARQIERLGTSLPSLTHHKALGGVLGYSSGALATVLTGKHPEDHGRMCLFTRAPEGGDRILKPLRVLGLLPRIIHERGRVRHLAGKAFARMAGLTGYVSLHRVPPEEFHWLDLPERDDIFNARELGGVPTFLTQARDAGLSVYAAPWQVEESRRWKNSIEVLSKDKPDLAFLYATVLDARLHEYGNRPDVVEETLAEIGAHVERARDAMGSDGADLTTYVVGDHGMADVSREVDPRRVVRRLGLRLFVDSTMLRMWGSGEELKRARREIELAGWPGKWLDSAALTERRAPVADAPYGDAFFLLEEGAIFVPSYVGGSVRGMHGYDISDFSARAALASDRPIPEGLVEIADLAPEVRRGLGIGP
ncbi:MAG: hypothetical protein DRJ42_28220 [Deltaproteobacteria bacterium]|nr:MAG: hypothetical protein DRJ42_28220 [Deltaproteobacteria bacterium]